MSISSTSQQLLLPSPPTQKEIDKIKHQKWLEELQQWSAKLDMELEKAWIKRDGPEEKTHLDN
jgi:hypothetical protein